MTKELQNHKNNTIFSFFTLLQFESCSKETVLNSHEHKLNVRIHSNGEIKIVTINSTGISNDACMPVEDCRTYSLGLNLLSRRLLLGQTHGTNPAPATLGSLLNLRELFALF